MNKQKETLIFASAFLFLCSFVCKPGSVCAVAHGDHLSLPPVTERLRDIRRTPPSVPPCEAVEPTGPCGRTHGVASDRVYSRSMLPWKWVSSYLAFPSLPSLGEAPWEGGLFLLPFSGGFPRLMLSVILLCDARTFLTVIPFGDIPRGRPTKLHGVIIPCLPPFVKSNSAYSFFSLA